jgi:protein TonB
MFEQTFVDQSNQTRKGASVFASFVVQVLAILVFVLIPLIYTEALPRTILTSYLTAPAPPPPPPPPPPPAAPRVVKAPPRQYDGRLMAPKQIPDKVALIQEDSLPQASNAGVDASVPGGVPGGSSVLGSMIAALPAVAAPPPAVKDPPKPATPQRVVVGGRVQQAMLIRQVKPVYPPLARTARVSGVVRFTAIIGKDGTIQNLQLVSGHPLLVPAAKDAVSQWLYKPTYLNTEPVEVLTQIEVNFLLGQ